MTENSIDSTEILTVTFRTQALQAHNQARFQEFAQGGAKKTRARQTSSGGRQTSEWGGTDKHSSIDIILL